ncbi:MAG: peptidylprolyl isomerase [Phycisphaerae bacterium]
MQKTALLLMLILTLSLSGCGWFDGLFGNDEQEPTVPVTKPTSERPIDPPRKVVQADEEPATAPEAPADTAEPESAPATAPAVTVPAEDNGTVISASDLQVNSRYCSVEELLRLAGPELKAIPNGVSEQSFRRKAAQLIVEEARRQITQMLVLDEAERRLSEEELAAIDQEMKEFKRQLVAEAGGSLTRLQQELKAEGISLEEVMDQQRRAMINQIYLRQKFLPAVTINRPMLEEAYLDRRDEEYTIGKKVKMQIIAAPVKTFTESRRPDKAEQAEARKKARKLIEQALAELKDGKDFEKVVKDLSKGPLARRGGTWPLMQKGNFKLEKVEAAAFRLSEGQRSDIIETDDGFYIVKALEVVPGKVVGFEEAQKELYDELRMEQYNKLVDEYIRGLFDKATIVRSDAFVELALDKAVKRYWKK